MFCHGPWIKFEPQDSTVAAGRVYAHKKKNDPVGQSLITRADSQHVLKTKSFQASIGPRKSWSGSTAMGIPWLVLREIGVGTHCMATHNTPKTEQISIPVVPHKAVAEVRE